jgi:anti-sigma factor RsiW
MSEKFEAETPRGCGRGEELVAYLYGETTKEEAALFRRHLGACTACREELAAFGVVRGSVGAWRAEALGTVPTLNIEEALAPRRRSARAALGEFFSLSPLWLRAAAFAAMLAFCALLALTLARAGTSEKIVEKRVEVPVQVGYTEEQVNAIVVKKVEEARAQLIAETKQQTDERRPEEIVNVNDGRKSVPQAPNPNAARRRRAPRGTSNRDDPMLAEDNLPRLSDLLSGSY